MGKRVKASILLSIINESLNGGKQIEVCGKFQLHKRKRLWYSPNSKPDSYYIGVLSLLLMLVI